jgi:hypothetical protein
MENIKISKETYLELKKIISEYENNKEIENEIENPYLFVLDINKSMKYNPKYGDDRICKCGHVYHRYFDSYDYMENVGCKYCNCDTFEEEIEK